MSSLEFYHEVKNVESNINKHIEDKQISKISRIEERIDAEAAKRLDEIRKSQ